MSRDGWQLIRSALRREWRGVAVGVVVGLCWTVAKVSVPALVDAAIDEGMLAGDTAVVWRYSFLILVVAVVAALFTGLRRYWAFRVSRWVEADLRQRLFAHVQRLHFGFHDRVPTGDLMSRANTDLQQIQAFVVLIPLTISNAVTVLAVTVILALIDPWLTVLALGSLPFLNVLGKRFSSRLHPEVMRIQQESGELAAVVEETVSGVRVVKGFGAEPYQRERLDAEADDLYDASLAATRVRSRFLPAMELLPNIGLILVLAVGGRQVIDGDLSLGALVAFNAYIVLLIWPLRMLGMIIAQGQRAAASGDRVHHVLATDPVIVDPITPVPLPSGAGPGGRVTTELGAVRFDDVVFGYEPTSGVAVLDHLDLRIEPGESVAVVGSTGSGKSTVARLLARFYDVDGGRVLLDGVDVRDVRAGRASGGHRHRVRGDVPLQRHHRRQHRLRQAPRRRRRHRAGGAPGRCPRVRLAPPGRVRHRGRRAGLLALGRPATAPRHRSGDRGRSARAHPRRRHLRRRPHQGARDP